MLLLIVSNENVKSCDLNTDVIYSQGLWREILLGNSKSLFAGRCTWSYFTMMGRKWNSSDIFLHYLFYSRHRWISAFLEHKRVEEGEGHEDHCKGTNQGTLWAGTLLITSQHGKPCWKPSQKWRLLLDILKMLISFHQNESPINTECEKGLLLLKEKYPAFMVFIFS